MKNYRLSEDQLIVKTAYAASIKNKITVIVMDFIDSFLFCGILINTW